MATKTDQLRQQFEDELRLIKDCQETKKQCISKFEQELINLENDEQIILDQLAELDGNDLVIKEEINEDNKYEGFDDDWLNEPIEVDLDTNAQGNTVH